MSKKILLDPKCPFKYSDDEYHKMYSETSYIIGHPSIDPNLRMYLLVDEHLCREMSDEMVVAELFREGHGNKLLKSAKSWFVGAHIVNLDRIRLIKEFMDSAALDLLESAKL